MSFEEIDNEYYFYLVAWLLLPLFLFMINSSGRRLGGFLVYTYFFMTIVAHWFGALAHASPWNQFPDSTATIAGFRLSSIALFAFAAGVLVVRPGTVGGAREQRNSPGRTKLGLAEASALGSQLFLPIGALSWIATFTPIASLPGMAAILNAGKACAVLGFCVKAWAAWHAGDKARFRLWIAGSAIFPVVTVLSAGFIGYGVGMIISLLMFVGIFYRPRWVLLLGVIGLLYGGVSFWVTYAKYREDIRSAVWGGAGLDARIETALTMLQALQVFDISNPVHLDFLDLRLNQNSLVGAAKMYTPASIPFRYGETIIAAFAAVIPRALWPDKPATGGSGKYVSEHTGMIFGEFTSVGMGQILEFYINFGTDGVVVGMFILGMVIRMMDIRLAEALRDNRWDDVMFWFLVGYSAMQPGGSLSEIFSSMAASVILALASKKFADRTARRRARRLAR